jgi:endonuclease/exonuclease/phosphatase family metal-dependent hydrolase
MIRQLKKFTLKMVAGANIATVIIMILLGFSDRLNPVNFHLLANAGLIYPALLIINVLFLIFWLIFYVRGALIPVLGFILAYSPTRTYMPLNISVKQPEGAIKILSYNVWLFAPWAVPAGEPNGILDYIRDSKAAIVCLQESAPYELGPAKLDSALNPIYQYRDSTLSCVGGDCISVYSKYPILSKERIKYKSRGNLSVAYKLRINGDTVILINNHLETVGLSEEDKDDFKALMKGKMKSTSAKAESRKLIYKIADAAVRRAPQAEAVARYIRQHQGKHIIVCGDFNDGPISYAHRTIAAGLTDCYRATANGPGISYHHGGMYVRIDNILCSKDITPYRCKVDNKISLSDHYPIYCWLKIH